MQNQICSCQATKEVNRNELFQKLSELRNECPALKEILIPEHQWSTFEQLSQEPLDEVGHKFKTLGALQLGILNKMTIPIHRYLLSNGSVKSSVTKNYKNALSENWMSKCTPIERHRAARVHDGKINELICASFLEDNDWKIDNLEALGGKSDIEATDPSGIQYSIEVKYIGTQNEVFFDIEKCCKTKQATARAIPIYDGYNYFLFRLFEASLQLARSSKKKLAIIVYSNHSWAFNAMPINDNWIWHPTIKFAENSSNSWERFLCKKKTEDRFKDIETELYDKIKNIDLTLVIKQDSNLDNTIEKIIENKKLN